MVAAVISQRTREIGVDQTVAVLAEQGVEAEASTVLLSNRAYTLWDGAQVSHTVVANGFVKEEGRPCEGCVGSLEEAANLLQPFVSKCLELKGGNDILVWRRRPAVEDDGGGKFKLTARLSWLKR